MDTLSTLPTNIVLSVIEHTGAESSLSLTYTCKTLYELSKTITFWLLLVSDIRKRRPIVIQEPYSVHALRTAVLSSIKIHHHWSTSGKFSIENSVIFQPDTTGPHTPRGANHTIRWDPWTKLDGKQRHFCHAHSGNEIWVRNFTNGNIIGTIRCGGLISVLEFGEVKDRIIICAHVDYEGESVNDISTLEIWDLARPETPLAVYKLDGYFGTLESLDGWVYFASLLMDRVSLLVLNLQTLASTITTIPVEVSFASQAELSRHLGTTVSNSTREFMLIYARNSTLDIQFLDLTSSFEMATKPTARMTLTPSRAVEGAIAGPPLNSDMSFEWCVPSIIWDGRLSIMNHISYPRNGERRLIRIYEMDITMEELQQNAHVELQPIVADTFICRGSSLDIIFRTGFHGQTYVWMDKDEDGTYWFNFLDRSCPSSVEPTSVIHFDSSLESGPGYGRVQVPKWIHEHGDIASLALDDACGRLLVVMTSNKVVALDLV